MPLNANDQFHLNAAAGHLQIGGAMDAWHELETISPLNRVKTDVLTVDAPRYHALNVGSAH